MGGRLPNRRDFIAGFAASAAWPHMGYAQQSGGVPRVGILWIAPLPVVEPFHEAFRQGLRDLGYVEGKTIVIEARFAAGKLELLPGLAEELARLNVDVIVAPATPIIRAVKQATARIPIVM